MADQTSFDELPSDRDKLSLCLETAKALYAITYVAIGKKNKGETETAAAYAGRCNLILRPGAEDRKIAREWAQEEFLLGYSDIHRSISGDARVRQRTLKTAIIEMIGVMRGEVSDIEPETTVSENLKARVLEELVNVSIRVQNANRY